MRVNRLVWNNTFQQNLTSWQVFWRRMIILLNATLWFMHRNAVKVTEFIEQSYLDVVWVSEEHGETIDAHPPASSRWKPVLQSWAEGLINEHGFIITLSFGLKKRLNPTCFYSNTTLKDPETSDNAWIKDKPWLAAQRAPSVWWDHSTPCRHYRFPSSSQRAQNALSGLSLICAWEL